MTARKPKELHGKAGRPTKYTQKIADEFCSRLENGENIIKICRDPRMPNFSTVGDWEDKSGERMYNAAGEPMYEVNGDHKVYYPGFASQLARARRRYADYIANEASALQDEAGQEWLDAEGRPRKNPETGETIKILTNESLRKADQQAKYRIWYAEKLHERYKPKQELGLTGPNGGPLQSVNANFNAQFEKDELTDAVKELLEKGV